MLSDSEKAERIAAKTKAVHAFMQRVRLHRAGGYSRGYTGLTPESFDMLKADMDAITENYSDVDVVIWP